MEELIAPISDAARKEAIRIVEDCKYSSKAHFNAADTWLRRHYWVGIPATFLGAAAGAAIIKDYSIVAALFSLGSTILVGLLTFLKPAERASTHKTAGNQYLSLRNEARIFSEFHLLHLTKPSAISDGISVLSKRRNSLNEASPIIPRKAFEVARTGIEQGEATYHVDKGEADVGN